MRSTVCLATAVLAMLVLCGCKVETPPDLKNSTLQSASSPWHGQVKKIATLGVTEALFDPTESRGVYYKLTKEPFAVSASGTNTIDLNPFVGKTITVSFQKQSGGILWGAKIVGEQ